MRAVPEIQRRRPRARIVVVGDTGVSYGTALPEGQTHKQKMLDELGSAIDRSRLHFLGPVPYSTLLRVYQVSSAHIYLTYPFVLSWSLLEAMAAGLRAVLPAPGRMQIRRGRNGSRVIDDSYNANPGSVKAALDALANFPGRRLLVLGDMAELGKDAQALHREVGAYAAAQGIDALYACGPLSALAAATFGAGGRAFADKTTLTQALIDLLAPDTTVLVKGSRAAGMEDVARQLDAGEEAGAALVK
jgi:glycosyltransferase involved in cell wall biosynthesis